MKIAVFYTNSHTSAWSLNLGLVDTLKRMGHEVLAGPIVPGATSISKASVPSFEELQSVDALIVSGPEYLTPYIRALYPNWCELAAPSAAWYHESNHREDKEFHFERFVPFYDFNFFPAPQDAEELKGEFMPFGVDTAMFNQHGDGWCIDCGRGETPARDIDAAFIGLMYPKRVAYYEALPPDIRAKLKVGNLLVQDLDGINIRRSAELYAETLRRIKVFVMMPALSQLVVTKVTEVKACGAYFWEAETKLPANFSEAARAQCTETHELDRLDQRLNAMLEKMGCVLHS